MSQLAIQQENQRDIPSATESIVACKALFNGEATRCKLKKMFNALPDKSRGLVLIAGGLPRGRLRPPVFVIVGVCRQSIHGRRAQGAYRPPSATVYRVV